MHQTFEALENQVVSCTRCPRLVAFRQVAPAKIEIDEEPWRRPVPGFGDPNAWLFILGLAPSNQGGNRTGRIFTGDASAKFLIKVLHKAGFSNQPDSYFRDDGLQLSGCYITAAVKCVPPQHHPLASEFSNCSSYFENEFFLLKNVRAVLTLGKMAFDAYLGFLKRSGILIHKSFAHNQKLICPGWPTLYSCYHPSPQNSSTGKITENMMLSFLQTIQQESQIPSL